jgi:hypothetical protein
MVNDKNPTAHKNLEGVINYFGKNSYEGGKMFTDLCALLLNEMGFEDIHIRKGNELGRDIDAKLGEQTWFFECKRYSKHIDTPEMAYKFLQLDMLADNLKPDYFVLISNGQMKSILKDIVEFKKTDKNTKYSVEIWTNEPYEELFNEILYSYSGAYIEYVKEKFNKRIIKLDKMIEEFEINSKEYLNKNNKFFNSYIVGIGSIKKQWNKQKEIHFTPFILDELYKETKDILLGFAWVSVLIGVPSNPISLLYDFSDIDTETSLVTMLKKWGLVLLKKGRNHLLFAENSHRTIIFDYGAIVLVSPILYGGSLHPSEWLISLRENCIRMRNFAKRGTLLVPATFRFYISNFTFSRSSYSSLSNQIEKLMIVNGLEDFLPESILPRKKASYQIKVPYCEIKSNDILIENPPNMHDEIGKPLAISFWKNLGNKKPLLQSGSEIDDIFKRVIKDHSDSSKLRDLISFDYSFQQSFNWLKEGELFDRSYDIFEKYLEEN